MLFCTTWKTRGDSPEQADRMMAVWGKLEADMAARSDIERECWYISADGTRGMTVVRASDPDAALAFNLETTLALGEFLELDTRPVLDLDTAMPAIAAGLERAKG